MNLLVKVHFLIKLKPVQSKVQSLFFCLIFKCFFFFLSDFFCFLILIIKMNGKILDQKHLSCQQTLLSLEHYCGAKYKFGLVLANASTSTCCLFDSQESHIWSTHSWYTALGADNNVVIAVFFQNKILKNH